MELLGDVPRAARFVIDYKLLGMNGLDVLAELRRLLGKTLFHEIRVAIGNKTGKM